MMRPVIAVIVLVAAAPAFADDLTLPAVSAPSPISENAPTASFDGSAFVVGWHAGVDPAKESLEGKRLAADGTQTALAPVVAPARFGCDRPEPGAAIPRPRQGYQITPHTMACDGKRAVEVWAENDFTAGSYRLFAQPGGGSPIELVTIARDKQLGGRFAGSAPRAAWDGARFLAVWEDVSESGRIHTIWALRFGRDGRALDAAPILV